MSIRVAFEQLTSGHVTQIGKVHHGGRWIDSSNNSKFAELWSAVRFYSTNHMQTSNVVAARLGRGVKELPALKGFDKAIT